MTQPLRVLLIDDQEHEFIRTADLLRLSDDSGSLALSWAQTFEQGLTALCEQNADVALVDLRLGARSGLELIEAANAAGCDSPLIVFTSRGDRSAEAAALAAGAFDYLEKTAVRPRELARTIAFAVRHHRALRQIVRAERYFRAVVEHSSDALLLLGEDGRIRFASQAAEQIIGAAGEALVGQPAWEWVHPEDRPLVMAACEPVLDSPLGRMRLEVRGHDAAGVCRYYEVEVANHLDDSALCAIVASVRDVTDRRQADEQQRFLASIVSSSSDGIFGATADGIVLSWNAGAERIFGYTAAEMIGASAGVLVPPERTAEAEALLTRLRRGTAVDHVETERLHRSGARVPVAITASPIVGPAGLSGIAVIVRDLRRQVAAQEALRAAQERQRFALQTAGIALWEYDFATERLHWSDWVMSAIATAGSRPPATLDEFAALVHGDDRARFLAAVGHSRTRGVAFRLEFRVLDGAGAQHWLDCAARVFEDTGCLVGVAVNVSDRKSLEEQFRQAQKMEAVGRLAGGVAHDFNNLLMVIGGWADLIGETIDPGDARRLELEEILKATQSAAALTRQLLAFSRRQVLQPRLVDPNAVVRGMERMMIRLLGEDIAVSLRLAQRVPAVWVDAGQMEQVILNLAVNARDAMPRGGKLIIETQEVLLDDTFVAAHRGSSPGRHAMISVTDNGCGIPKDVLPRVFEPFFTTKGRGVGTGLGLSTVYGIVKQSLGSVFIESEPDAGTVVRVFLPAADADAVQSERQPSPAVKSERSESETVLIVDDQEDIRNLLRFVLVRAGFAVLEAGTPSEAIELGRTHDGAIDAVITDVVMPESNGRTLAAALREQRPDIRVLYMSGYTDSAIVQFGVLQPDLAFLHKPFMPAALLRALRDLLDAADPNPC